MTATKFTATTGIGTSTETFTRTSTLDLTHAVIGTVGTRTAEIAHRTAWLDRWEGTGVEDILIRNTKRDLIRLAESDSVTVHRVLSWHTSEDAATRKRRVGETVVAVTEI
tara:strand:- start:36 stop:365 length:330 start_codon:yes stop_codon:yes gene_type:complete